MKSKEIFLSLVEKGVLVSPDIFEKQIYEQVDEDLINEILQQNLDYIDEQVIKNLKEQKNDKKELKNKSRVKILQSYNTPPRKRTIQDFISLFNNRYLNISQMLKSRRELTGLISISRLKNKSQNEKVSIIGMISEKTTTKNNSIILTLEDLTGQTNVVIVNSEKNKEVYDLALDLSLDETIGILGTWINSAVFPDKIFFPDIPLNKELKKQKEEEYMAVIGDTHFGSKVFLEEEFKKFIEWINSPQGENVKYIILPGDIVEGVGIYPSQEQDLKIIDIQEQYKEAAKWLKMIPDDKEIIIISGNHDPGRLSEPQEKPFKDLAKELWEMPNVILASNPSYINIGQTKEFPGFDILLYHGGSLIYYSDNVPSIRAAGGQKRSDLIMKYLLQRRHLAPAHGSTLYLPDSEKDYLLIDIIPDFFITGHIHRSSVANYRNITMINASCWTETTEDQIKRGLEPLPGRVILVNLKTRDVKILNFLTDKSKEKESESLKEIKKLSDIKEDVNKKEISSNNLSNDSFSSKENELLKLSDIDYYDNIPDIDALDEEDFEYEEDEE